MPNWCSNELNVTHPDPAKLQEFVDAYNDGRMCAHFCPQPETVPAGEVVNMPDGTPVKTMSNAEWGWRINAWGTKWDIRPPSPAAVTAEQVTVGFESAWSPPIGVYQALEDQGYRVDAMYFEPGCDFCGAYKDGEDDTWSCHDDDVPDEIRDAFDFDSFFSEDD
jgi:hypothetical protein